MRERLRDLAERPARVISGGTYDDIIREDEALRGMIRGFPDSDADSRAGSRSPGWYSVRA